MLDTSKAITHFDGRGGYYLVPRGIFCNEPVNGVSFGSDFNTAAEGRPNIFDRRFDADGLRIGYAVAKLRFLTPEDGCGRGVESQYESGVLPPYASTIARSCASFGSARRLTNARFSLHLE